MPPENDDFDLYFSNNPYFLDLPQDRFFDFDATSFPSNIAMNTNMLFDINAGDNSFNQPANSAELNNYSGDTGTKVQTYSNQIPQPLSNDNPTINENVDNSTHSFQPTSNKTTPVIVAEVDSAVANPIKKATTTDTQTAMLTKTATQLKSSSIAAIKSPIVRPKTAPLICNNHYIYTANWPPIKPTSCTDDCTLARRNDVYPDADAPLHVWVQAYALRWATWAATIDDAERRDRVINLVTDKMKLAWETAIKEGYYPRPRDFPPLANTDEHSQTQNKRPRKRALSFSKSPAGFVYDNNDRHGITNAELAIYNLTMDQIKQRVADDGLAEGQKRMKQVLDNLPDGQTEISVRDWSGSSVPTVNGRDILTYCFWVIQQSRKEVAKLTSLLDTFKKPQQIFNTEKRIELQDLREAQHMALATEICLQEPNTFEESEGEDGDEQAVEDLHEDKDGDEQAIEDSHEKDVPDEESLGESTTESSEEEPVDAAPVEYAPAQMHDVGSWPSNNFPTTSFTSATQYSLTPPSSSPIAGPSNMYGFQQQQQSYPQYWSYPSPAQSTTYGTPFGFQSYNPTVGGGGFNFDNPSTFQQSGSVKRPSTATQYGRNKRSKTYYDDADDSGDWQPGNE